MCSVPMFVKRDARVDVQKTATMQQECAEMTALSHLWSVLVFVSPRWFSLKAYRHLRKSAHQYLNLLSLMSGAGIKDLADDPAAVLQLVRGG